MRPSSSAEPWVSIEDVAVHVGVRKESIYRWIERRGLPASKVGKLWKLKLSEVDAWMRERQAGKRAGPVNQGPTVIVVDDDEAIRENLRDFLSDESYGVLLAGDGADALAQLQRASPKPALIILDLGMPRMDGWRFREQQLADAELSAIPTIVVTADATATMRGVTVLRKPLRLDELRSAMDRVMADAA